MSSTTDIWTFKHEPKTFDQMILNVDMKNKLGKALKELPNLMIVGSPGVGKGTFTNILIKETKLDYMKINASDETSVDTMRTKVKSFATALGISPIKLVILNECLEENEKILIGCVGDTQECEMKNLPTEKFSLPSFNVDKQLMETDVGEVITDKIDDVYEIILLDGRTITTSGDHPFLVIRDGKMMFVKLVELSMNDEIYTVW